MAKQITLRNSFAQLMREAGRRKRSSKDVSDWVNANREKADEIALLFDELLSNPEKLRLHKKTNLPEFVLLSLKLARRHAYIPIFIRHGINGTKTSHEIACSALKKLGTRAIPHLDRALNDTKIYSRAVCMALTEFGPPGVEVLARSLRHSQPRVAEEAARALALMSSRKALNALKAVARKRSPGGRAAARELKYRKTRK